MKKWTITMLGLPAVAMGIAFYYFRRIPDCAADANSMRLMCDHTADDLAWKAFAWGAAAALLVLVGAIAYILAIRKKLRQ